MVWADSFKPAFVVEFADLAFQDRDVTGDGDDNDSSTAGLECLW